GSTINFNGTGSQTITAFNYDNLTSSSTGGRTLASSGTIGIASTFTPGSNTYTTTNSTIAYNGTTALPLPSGFATYYNLTVNNATGASLSGSVTVTATLSLASGTLAVGSNTLTLNGAVSSTGGGLSS